MRKTRVISSALLCVSLCLLASCHKGASVGVVARVNGKPIEQADLDKAYAAQLQNNPQQQPSVEQANSLKLNILHELVLEEFVEQRAAKLGLTATDAEVDAKLQEMKASYTEDQFNARLKAANLTLENLRHDLRRSLTQTKLLNKEINSKIAVTDNDVDAYYAAHKAEFNLAENTYHLGQITVTTTPNQATGNLENSKATSSADALKKIQALKNRLDSGEDFGTIAMHFSENPQTASNGGDMGSIPESQLKSNPVLFTAIGKLKAGQDTDIIPYPDPNDPKKVGGYLIFRLLEKAQAGQRDLSDPRVQQAIRQQIHESRSQVLKAAYFEILRDESKVDNYLAEQIFKDSAK